jgi:putative membrane protein
MTRLILAWLHLLALGIGLGAIWVRARTLGRTRDGAALDSGTLRRAFVADGWWGGAAALWIGTGLWRLLAGTEKTTAYYLRNDVFLLKMTLLLIILALELWPMVTLVRWRRLAGADASRAANRPDLSSYSARARHIATISYLQAALVAAMVLAAVSMARGYGARG